MLVYTNNIHIQMQIQSQLNILYKTSFCDLKSIETNQSHTE